MAYGTYMIIPIPYYLALEWFLYGTAQAILLGAVAAAVSETGWRRPRPSSARLRPNCLPK
jgi:hypothetical protein